MQSLIQLASCGGSAGWSRRLLFRKAREEWNHFFMGDHFEKGQHALLNEGEENEMELFGYRTQGCRKTLCLAGSIFSFGILPLVFYWRPAWHVWANCVPCSLQDADVVLLRTTDEFHTYSWKKVMWIYLSTLNSTFGVTPDHPLITDEEDIINRAIRKPDLKVSTFMLTANAKEI
uniref:probable cation-transporting ATPase 13A4 n=1 Tax=Panthera onca TaxID=9690 RepID=UPI002952B25D|nr:probable cation-transporting ATPase 13A4 [Panthera onca]